ncbi:type VI secretion lipoprotein TssJ [Salmonella enterica subsp. enterica]|nr:type VI secretion lipoprotein TssJ [Salmonella enterica subsp. enterica]
MEIRVYELKNDAAFTTKSITGRSMTTTNCPYRRFSASRQLYLRPAKRKLRRSPNAQTTAIGVLAGYRNPPNGLAGNPQNPGSP